MNVVRALDKAIDILSKVAITCGGLLLMAMAINVTYGVIARYVFHSPSVYAIELTKILMIPALVLAVSYVQRYDKHLKVDFLSMRYPQKIRLILLEIIVPIMGLFVGYVLVWKGWTAMAYSYSIGETSYSSWAEPLWPVKLAIPIGYAILCIVMVAQLCKGVAVVLRMRAGTTKGSEVTSEDERV